MSDQILHNSVSREDKEQGRSRAIPFEHIRNLDSEKLIVLSFRALQLKRITELQQELLRLQGALATGGSSKSKEKEILNPIDAVLQQYGKLCYSNGSTVV